MTTTIARYRPSFERTFLPNDVMDNVFNYLNPQDLARAEPVCRSWKEFINARETNQWKMQCHVQLNIPESVDPMTLLPPCASYKEGLKIVRSKVYGGYTYRSYLGAKIIPTPQHITLRKWFKPDPCDPSKTIGENYVWIYSPSHFEITVDEGTYYLDGPDDPNNQEAPRLIRAGFFSNLATSVEIGVELMLGFREGCFEKASLKVPNTINNLNTLFKYPQQGNSSEIFYTLGRNFSLEQHGNKRIPTGWICMRNDVFAGLQPFDQQQVIATQAGVEISQLGHRILFNFIKHAETNVYPDGPGIDARTSTITRNVHFDEDNSQWIHTLRPSYCGNGGGWQLFGSYELIVGADDRAAGIAVALPEA